MREKLKRLPLQTLDTLERYVKYRDAVTRIASDERVGVRTIYKRIAVAEAQLGMTIGRHSRRGRPRKVA